MQQGSIDSFCKGQRVRTLYFVVGVQLSECGCLTKLCLKKKRSSSLSADPCLLVIITEGLFLVLSDFTSVLFTININMMLKSSKDFYSPLRGPGILRKMTSSKMEA